MCSLLDLCMWSSVRINSSAGLDITSRYSGVQLTQICSDQNGLSVVIIINAYALKIFPASCATNSMFDSVALISET